VPIKRTKQEVDYSYGHPPDGEFCEVCLHYKPIGGEAPECACVLGSVKWDYWCRLFKRAGPQTRRVNRAMRDRAPRHGRQRYAS
jgi:hypothetical protein